MATPIPPDLPADPITGIPTPEQIAWALEPMPLADALAMIRRVAEQTGGYTPRLAQTEHLLQERAAVRNREAR